MVRIQDKMGEWCGELKFKTEDETEFTIKPTLKHRRELMFLEKKVNADNITEEDLLKQDEVIIDILRSAYPDFNEEQVDAIVQSYGTEILLELYYAWKWRDRAAVEAFKKKQQMEIDKITKPEDSE